MIVFGVVVAAIVVAGTGLATILWRRLDPEEAREVSTLERVAAGAVVGSAVWIGVSWLLALTHTLTATALWILAGVTVASAIPFALTFLPALNRTVPPGAASRALLLVPVLLWSAFALWRGAVLPPSTHDALAYHLPRALMIARASGFEHFPSADVRLNTYPANYELLLADVILMSGSDRLTEWVSTAMFGLFLLGAGTMARRWWRYPTAAIEVILATALTPLLLLHSSAHKNDLMAGAFAVTALVWGARWFARGGRMPMLLLVASLVLGGGTKPQVAGVLVGLAPFLLIRAIREWRAGRLQLRHIALTAALAIGFFVIGGAAPYMMLFTHPPPAGTAASAFPWGDMENLWQVPILLLLAPFSSSNMAVWVPWRHEHWFWPRYEIYFSNYGALFSILLLLLPIALLLARRNADEDSPYEHRTAGIATLIAILVILPAEIRPVGFFAAMGRYLIFTVPVVISSTLPPLFAALRSAFPFNRLTESVIAAGLVIAFVFGAYDSALHDRFAPLRYVRIAAALPGTRTIWFEPNRAASVVDRMAGPHDTIAVAGSFDTWVYPAYGARLTREVILLHAAATAKEIPPSADWVIVDRSWNKIWSHPRLTDMGQFWKYVGRGTATPEDLQIYSQLMSDRRFRLVFRNPSLNQAVFKRVGAT